MSATAEHMRLAASKNASAARETALDAVAWCLPLLLCCAIYWPGLLVWFQADDFAWLSLHLDIHDWPTLRHALFAPMAQGTIRPLSERAFFLIFQSLFGWNAPPYRICVFLTQCASLTLLGAITRRLTGSRAIACWAAVLWVVNSSLITSMVWCSAYNQVLCGFFLLGAFWFLLRYIEGGKTSDYLWQWLLFLLGFGALEMNVVYPALAASYTYLLARKHFSATLPLFIPSIAFAWIDRVVAGSRAAGNYALHFDHSLPATLTTYWRWALVTQYVPNEMTQRLETVILVILTLCILGFTVRQVLRGDRFPLFCLAWFVIVLAPVLPLSDHISIYYLTLPSLGLAILGAYAAVKAWQHPGVWKLAVMFTLALYALPAIHLEYYGSRLTMQQTGAIRRMVLGVVRAHQLHPDKTILLQGVDSNLFWMGMFHNAFRTFGVPNVYLTPGAERHIEAHEALGHVSDFVLPTGPALEGVKMDQLVVYRIDSVRLKEITSSFEANALSNYRPEVPSRIDVSNSLTQYLLGPEWYPAEGTAHWMPKSATLRIGGPKRPGELFYVHGFPSSLQLNQPPVTLRVTADGMTLPDAQIDLRGDTFSASFPLPDQLVGRSELKITLTVSRTFPNGTDTRELGLNFGVFEVR